MGEISFSSMSSNLHNVLPLDDKIDLRREIVTLSSSALFVSPWRSPVVVEPATARGRCTLCGRLEDVATEVSWERAASSPPRDKDKAVALASHPPGALALLTAPRGSAVEVECIGREVLMREVDHHAK